LLLRPDLRGGHGVSMKTVLDKRFVADCRFDEVPAIDEDGKGLGHEPNAKGRFYDVGDLHNDAPVGFALRVCWRRPKTAPLSRVVPTQN